MDVLSRKNIVVEIISSLLVALFLYGAFSKLLDYQKFQVQLSKSPILTMLADYISWIVPVTEIIVSGMLVLKRFQLLGLYASFTLMVVFTAYIFFILNYGSYIPCSCGGILEQMNWIEHLWFNVFFIFLSALGVLIYGHGKQNIAQ